MLFVHGGFHGAWCWAPFLTLFKTQGVPAAAIDLSGHGGLAASADFGILGLSHMAEAIAEAAAQLGGPVILAGHSLGALACMAAAERIKPRGLVLLAPAPPANITGLKLLPPFPTDRPVSPPGADRARKWFLGGYSGADIADYVQRLCPESPAFLNDLYCRKVVVNPAWIEGPTLCISGGRDDTPLHPAGQDEAVAAFFGAELQILPRAGHCFMLDDSHPEAGALILAWLRRNNLSGGILKQADQTRSP